jgi:hypothetical protein
VSMSMVLQYSRRATKVSINDRFRRKRTEKRQQRKPQKLQSVQVP